MSPPQRQRHEENQEDASLNCSIHTVKRVN
jgi:hypothetical protein